MATTGVLAWADMRRAIMLNTGFFETSQYFLENQMKIIAGNWDGAGMSAGNLQYNFGPADRLSEFFNHLLTNHESVVIGVFGAETAKYEEFKTMNLTYTRANKIAWCNGITDYTKPSPDGHALIEPWKTILGNLMNTPESYDKYFEMMDAYYVPNALDLFKQLNCTSRASLASLFDLNVNRGRFYPCATLVWDFEGIDARVDLTPEQKEAEKIKAINNRGNDTTNGMDASASGFVQRRDAMANQGGDYWGSLYDPETQFDINQEPAILDKQAGFGNDVKLGAIDAKNLFVGSTPIKSIYLGATLVGNAEITPYTTNKVPDTQFRTNSNSYVGFESGSIAINEGKKIWVDCQNFVACKTYYTTDGTTPTTASTRYTDGIVLPVGTYTLKTLTVSLSGVAEVVKTCTVTVNAMPVTTISPTTIAQNAIPITVTLTSSEVGATIKYKLGNSATEYTYTGPFSVNQNSAGVASTQIKITYWSIGANGTETAKTLTYDTSGSIPATPVVSVTNGDNQVALSWGATANTTSYTIYRSTTAGALGTILSGTQYMTGTSWTDTTALNGTTYYYTVQAGNFGTGRNSAQVTGAPRSATFTGWRYVRFVGYGDNASLATTRLVEFQALEGATNRIVNLLPMAGYAPTNAGDIVIATNGEKAHVTGYPIWWTGQAVADLHYDMGANYLIDKINVTGYSPVTDPRQTKFKVYVSTDNINWTSVVDYSTNTIVQPEAGFDFSVPQG